MAKRGVGFVKRGAKCRKGLRKVTKRIKGVGTRFMCVG
jgi:hypothetical protein